MSNARKLADNLPSVGQLGNRNILINGAHQVSQRHGSSSVTVAPSDHYVVDRFKIQDYSDATFSSQQVSDAPTGFEYSSKLTVTGTDTSLGTTQYQRFIQPVEGLNVSHLNWGSANAKTVTFSFHVKSSLTGTFSVFVFNSAANRSFISTYTISTANTWEKKIITISGDQSGTWLTTSGVGMYIGWSLGTGTNFQTSTLDAWDGSFKMAGSNQVNFAGTNGATWKVTGCQLEVGSQASPFEHEPIATTVAKCERYHQRFIANGVYPYFTTGRNHSSTVSIFTMHYRTEMRSNPSMTVSDVGDIRIYDGYDRSMTGFTINGNSTTTCGINFTGLSSGAGNNYAAQAYFYDNVNGYVALDAEL